MFEGRTPNLSECLATISRLFTLEMVLPDPQLFNLSSSSTASQANWFWYVCSYWFMGFGEGG